MGSVAASTANEMHFSPCSGFVSCWPALRILFHRTAWQTPHLPSKDLKEIWKSSHRISIATGGLLNKEDEASRQPACLHLFVDSWRFRLRVHPPFDTIPGLPKRRNPRAIHHLQSIQGGGRALGPLFTSYATCNLCIIIEPTFYYGKDVPGPRLRRPRIRSY